MNKFAVALTVVLLLEGGLFYSASGLEKIPENRPLEFFPLEVQDWHMVMEGKVDKDTQDVLRADDTLSRAYISPAHPEGVSMFMAYFRTQRHNQTPHSPKNCLPGAGWESMQEGMIDINVPGEPNPITINRYVVSHGDSARVVLYWYQSRRRVVASDYAAKFWLVADSVRYHRSDTAIVRVEAPVIRGDDARATRGAEDFVKAMFPLLIGYLPS